MSLKPKFELPSYDEELLTMGQSIYLHIRPYCVYSIWGCNQKPRLYYLNGIHEPFAKRYWAFSDVGR